ncbi:LTA synthase family protein [Massilia sp.]|uniref:LTA synthase family protein n=1 Tax=Massilia sp. TaxID=1882437 RepID=UPI0028ACB26F|nr:LTA synthase family protein [Massilia sp.]
MQRTMFERLGRALAFACEALPALVLAWLCLRIAEAIHASGAGVAQSSLFGASLGNDLLSLLRFGFVFLLGALPLALVPSRRWRTVLLGLVWSVLLLAHAALLQYHWISGVPLGADLFAYSGDEVKSTVAGGFQLSPLLGVAAPAALAVLWLFLALTLRDWWPRAPARTAAVFLAASLAGFVLLPQRFMPPVARSDADAEYLLNKTAFFIDSNLAQLRAPDADAAAPHARAQTPWSGSDPAHPFAHIERTPDTLGPLFDARPGAPPPNLVFVIVEGLGRSFSGPGARLGSFTPFLDELAGKSLYFENFLSGQGRTFGVLTTVFGSLPFGENGLAALGDKLPRHESLLTVLKSQDYRLRFYSGSNLEFDNEGLFLRRQGVDTLVSEKDFGPPYKRSNDWGYADRDLVEVALAREAQAPAGPFVSILQTTSMHSPFTFPGKDDYLRRVDARLAELKLARTPIHENGRDIFASILYTDDALRLFFERAQKLPGYENTIFVITGDHRLPELPMDTRIERYHVPLIVYSPLLKAPRAIKSVSSQFDIAPSLLAYLSNNHGLKSPKEVSWIGTGLDTEQSFRNLHAIPLKQTKTEMSDFVSGTAYLAQGQLYTLGDGMQTDRNADAGALARAQAQFRDFLQANGTAGRSAALLPAAKVELAAYGGERTLRGTALAVSAGDVGVSGLRRVPGGKEAEFEATFTNHGAHASPDFVPLLVITNEHALELNETVAPALTLGPGESRTVRLRPRLDKVAPGSYFVSVLPSHPATGRPVGVGQYHVETRL